MIEAVSFRGSILYSSLPDSLTAGQVASAAKTSVAVSLGVPESSTLVWVTRGRRLQEARTMSENASAIHTGFFNVTYEVEVRDEQATAVRNATQKIQKNHTDFEDLLGKQL